MCLALLEKVSSIGIPITCVYHFGAGRLDFLQVGGKICQEEFMVIFAYDFGFGVIFLQTFLEPLSHFVTEGVILTEDVKLLFLFSHLTVIIGKGRGRPVLLNK